MTSWVTLDRTKVSKCRWAVRCDGWAAVHLFNGGLRHLTAPPPVQASPAPAGLRLTQGQYNERADSAAHILYPVCHSRADSVPTQG